MLIGINPIIEKIEKAISIRPFLKVYFNLQNRCQILYLGIASIPSRSANSLHIMKMCDAFSIAGLKTTLILPDVSENENSVDSSHSFYGTSGRFSIKKITIFKFQPHGIYMVLFALIGLLPYLISRGRSYVYTRNFLIASVSCILGFRTFLELHSPLEGIEKTIMKRIQNQLIKNLCKVIFITKRLRDHVVNEFPFIENLAVVLPDGVDLPKYASEIPRVIKETEKSVRIRYIGSLYRGKGIEIILEIAKIAPEYEFEVFGGDEKSIEYWRQEIYRNAISNVKMMGYLIPSEVPEIQSAADILIMPYSQKVYARGNTLDITDWMSPLKMFEYMATGKPIIASDLSVIREVLSNRINALLCNPCEPSDWKLAIKWIIDNPVASKEIANRAKNDVVQYSWESRAKRVIEFIFRDQKSFVSRNYMA